MYELQARIMAGIFGLHARFCRFPKNDRLLLTL